MVHRRTLTLAASAAMLVTRALAIPARTSQQLLPLPLPACASKSQHRGRSAIAREAAQASSATALKSELMRGLRRKGTSAEEAARHVEELRSLGKFESPRGYAAVITACGKGNKWQLAEQLLREQESENEAETELATEARAKAKTKTKAKARPGTKAATDSGRRAKMDLGRYSRGALMQRLRRRAAEPSDLDSTVAALVQEGHLERADGYTLALRMCESGEQWEWAVRLLEMCRDGPGLEVETCNVGVAACSKSQQWERALWLLEAMEEWSVEADPASWHAATSACSRSGEWEAAVAALERARQAGLADGETQSIGMMACASASAWAASLAMLSGLVAGLSSLPSLSRQQEREKEREQALLGYGIAVFGCEQGGAWPWCLRLLEEMRSDALQPDGVTCACAVKACSAAEGKAAREAAVALLTEMRSCRLGESAEAVLEEASWVTDGPEMQQPVPLSALATMAPKEVEVYKYVAKRATPGDVDSVLEAIESYASSRKWLKIQGQQKRELLERSLRLGDRIVEFGCYVGYSSLVMARQLRKLGGEGSVTTIEVDAATAYVARAMISFAGAEGEVQVRVGCASDWIATGQLGTIDFLLLDHRGTIYHEDLHAAEPILSPQARVFADNVLYPGAPLFLHYIDVQGYEIEIHELKEFMRPDLDDWVVICQPRNPHGPMPRDTPPEMRRLSAEVDAISWRSQQGPVDWVAFQERLKPVFYSWKEERGL